MKHVTFKTLIVGLLAAALFVTAACTKRDEERRAAERRAAADNVTVNVHDNGAPANGVRN